MAKEDYPKTNIKLAEIPNDLDRVFKQQLNWHLEFPQVKNRAEFFKFGVPIIKLPANIYDPDGYRTDSNGIPTNHKGVWLSAYQLKMSVAGGSSRKTGSIYQWTGGDFNTKSHFDLNHSPSVPDDNPVEGDGVGMFPYEKPWSTTYPNQYKIPAKPVDQRYQYSSERTPSTTPGVYYLDEPAYNDGDLIGYEVNGDVGGLGSQSAFGQWFHNRIAESVTRNWMYKYEDGVAWNEEYANGYQPHNPSARFAGVSKVINGEKYQRFESGYGYFLRPNGWPRTMRTTWGADTYFGPDIQHGKGLGGDPENPGPGTTTSIVSDGIWASYSHVNDVYNMLNIQLALSMGSNSAIKDGTLEAYRIIDSNPNNLKTPEQFVLPTFIRLAVDDSAGRCYSFVLTNTGEIPVTMPFLFHDTVSVDGVGQVSSGYITLNPGQGVRVTNPADGGPVLVNSALGWTNHLLPGNSGYNPSTNRYESAKYQLRISITGDVYGANPKYINLNKVAKTTPDQWYIKTSHWGGNNGKVSNGINTLFGGDSTAEVWHIIIEDNNNSYDV